MCPGLFGFLINPPLAVNCMQALNTTPTHGNAALFGVYGMLGLGLMPFCVRVADVRRWSALARNELLAPQLPRRSAAHIIPAPLATE